MQAKLSPTARSIHDVNFTAVDLDGPFRDSQAETRSAALAVPRGIDPEEPFKDACPVFRRNTRSLIGDSDHAAIAVLLDANRDGPTSRASLMALSRMFVSASRRTSRST